MPKLTVSIPEPLWEVATLLFPDDNPSKRVQKGLAALIKAAGKEELVAECAAQTARNKVIEFFAD